MVSKETQDMSSSAYTISQRENVTIFTIARPERANALSREVLLGLGHVARQVDSDKQSRALIITGEGERFFCAGADLKERRGWNEDQIRDQIALYRTELGALDSCSKPVIAAINGMALGGGVEIAMCCDLRVCVQSAVFAQPEVGLGIVPGAGGTQRLPRLIGEARAKEMILLGRRIDAEHALSWGLVNRMTHHDTGVVEDTLVWLEPVLKASALAVKSALQAIDAARFGTLEQGLAVERLVYDDLIRAKEHKEALQAFSEKGKDSK